MKFIIDHDLKEPKVSSSDILSCPISNVSLTAHIDKGTSEASQFNNC